MRDMTPPIIVVLLPWPLTVALAVDTHADRLASHRRNTAARAVANCASAAPAAARRARACSAACWTA